LGIMGIICNEDNQKNQGKMYLWEGRGEVGQEHAKNALYQWDYCPGKRADMGGGKNGERLGGGAGGKIFYYVHTGKKRDKISKLSGGGGMFWVHSNNLGHL